MDGMDTRLENLERELRHCRRSARRDRWAVISLAVVLALLGIGRMTQLSRATEVLRVKQLLVLDDRGQVRANLSASGLDLSGGKDKPSVSLSTLGDCALLYLSTKGRSGVFLSASADDSQLLSLFDQKGNHRVLLRSDSDESGLQLCDETGKRRASLGVLDKSLSAPGKASLSLYDTESASPLWQTPSK